MRLALAAAYRELDMIDGPGAACEYGHKPLFRNVIDDCQQTVIGTCRVGDEFTDQFSEYYAIASSDHGYGILKVTSHMGKIIKKGPFISHHKGLNEAVLVVRDMNYGVGWDEPKPKKKVSN